MSGDHQHEHELVEPFDIDHGELDGIRPQVVFYLGVEWQSLRELLDTGHAIDTTIHSENGERVGKMCLRRGRQFEVVPYDDQWSFLKVEEM